MPLPLPESNASPDSAPQKSGKPARVLDLRKWIEKMPKEPNNHKDEEKPVREMSPRELMLRIMDLASTEGLDADALYEMVEALEKIVAKKVKP